MTDLRRACCTFAAALAVLLPSHTTWGAAQRNDDRPSLALRATPPAGFSPLRVRATVELRGGRDDYEDFYCAAVEWEWGDGTTSESASDCEPFEAGRSTIQRRFSAEHVFRESGRHRIVFRLKQKDRQVATANATITVRPGAGEDFGRW